MKEADLNILARLSISVILSRRGYSESVPSMLCPGGADGGVVEGAVSRLRTAAGDLAFANGIGAVDARPVPLEDGDVHVDAAPGKWRVEVEGRSADFTSAGPAASFALAINMRMLRIMGSRLADVLRDVLEGESPEAMMGMTVMAMLHGEGRENQAPDDGVARRRDRRESAMFMATVRSASGYEIGTIRVRNLSSTGLMADRSPPLEQGACVEVEIRNVGGVKAQIAWRDGDRVGMAFDTGINPTPAIRGRI